MLLTTVMGMHRHRAKRPRMPLPPVRPNGSATGDELAMPLYEPFRHAVSRDVHMQLPLIQPVAAIDMDMRSL